MESGLSLLDKQLVVRYNGVNLMWRCSSVYSNHVVIKNLIERTYLPNV